MIMRQFLVKEMPYDTQRDFTPVARIGEAIAAIFISAEFPAKSYAEMIDYAKRNPGKVSYSTTGIGTTHHLSGHMIGELSNINWVHVPYKSGPQAMTDLIGGQIELAFENAPNCVPHVQANRLRAIGVTTLTRARALPDVPPIAEAGVPGSAAPAGSTRSSYSFLRRAT